MNDRGKIVAGLIIFLVLITTPIWMNLVAEGDAEGPEIEILTKDVPGQDKCVKSKTEMAAQHMDLLNTWRDEVVRSKARVYQTADGRYYAKSLTHTCLKCHSNKDKFCDRCHIYVGVNPYCWDCHNEPKEFK
ncbi:MAG: hypothetical protein FJY65_00135 [Calditrichaeota bacterium]|nr:hypothetical protein [Calditrichota bacterium]